MLQMLHKQIEETVQPCQKVDEKTLDTPIQQLEKQQLEERKALSDKYAKYGFAKPPPKETRAMRLRQRVLRKELMLNELIRYRILQQDERDLHEGYQSDKLTSMDDTFRDRENRPQSTVVHIRVQKRNARKWITSLQNLSIDLDLHKICAAIKQTYSVNGSVTDSEEFGLVIQFTGDIRTRIKEFLIDYGICTEDTIKIHGD